MNTRSLLKTLAFLILCASLAAPAIAEDAKVIPLPKPQLDKSKSFAQALQDRKSSREFQDAALPPQTLSNLLWAAFGINRPDAGRRTAPSALNWQEIDIYVVTKEGACVYEPKAHALTPVASGDLRALTGTQPFCATAPLALVYVADLKKAGTGEGDETIPLCAADTGFIGQNVYLFCAAEGLATVFRARIDKPKLSEALKLGPDQKIMYCQTVGTPKSGK